MAHISNLYTLYDVERLSIDIENDCLEVVENTLPFFVIDADVPGQCVFELFNPPPSLHNWNKFNNPFGDGYRVAVQRMYKGDRLWPHIDGKLDPAKNIYPREYAINYLLSESGPVTEWYREQDVSTVFDSVVFPARTWHRIATNVWHGAKDIVSPRIAVTMVKVLDLKMIEKYQKQYHEQS